VVFMQTLTLSERAQGRERKEIMNVISELVGKPVYYAGAPTFAFESGGWTLDRNGTLTSPEVEPNQLRRILDALKENSLTADGSLILGLKEEAEDKAIRNLQNLLSSKASLFRQALGNETDLEAKQEGKTVFFMNLPATLEWDELSSTILLCRKLLEQAKLVDRVSPKEDPTDNPKYSMRCFLLRLGFIGDEYKAARKQILRNLEGSSAFRTIREGEEKPC